MPKKVFFKIVVPNYNNFAYLKKCLDSISAQTFRDFLCVVVDDMSTDESPRLARIYERRDPEHFAVVSPGKKLYAGGCRNAGIDFPVESEYTCFVDSDDYYSSQDSLKILYDSVKDGVPDVLLFDWERDVAGRISRISVRQDIEEVVRNGKLAMCYWNASWSRISRSSMTERFLEGGCMYGEDTYQFLRIMDRNPKVRQIHETIYVYRNNPTGAVNTKNGIHEKTRGIFFDAIRKLSEEARTESVARSCLRRLERDGYR